MMPEDLPGSPWLLGRRVFSTSHIKTFQEMYINVGMANHEKRPKQEQDDIRFTHIATPTFFY